MKVVRAGYIALVLLLLLSMLGFASAATPDVNIVKIDGVAVHGTATGWRTIYNYNLDGNLTIDFNVHNADINGCGATQGCPGDGNTLLASIYYSTDANSFTNSIIADLNLMAVAAPGDVAGTYCDDLNFAGNDQNTATTCRWDFNVNSTLISDGNYYIDINVYTALEADKNGADSIDFNIGIDNVPSVTITKIDGIDVDGATTGWRSIFNYHLDGNLTIDFNIIAMDLNYDSIAAGNADLNATLFYSTAAGGFTTAIISDLNLFSGPSNGIGSGYHCDDMNFSSGTMAAPGDVNDGAHCWLDWNIHMANVADANYFIDVNINNVRDQLVDLDMNASDSSDFNFGIDNVPNITIAKLDGGLDSNAGMYFSYIRDGNVTIDFNVTAIDLNVSTLAGVIGSLPSDLNLVLSLYYSSASKAFSTAIISDLNLFAVNTVGDLTSGSVYCDDLNFSSGTASTPNDVNDGATCHWDFNIMSVLDANYFIDANITLKLRDADKNTAVSSDYNYRIDNLGPVVSITSPPAGHKTSNPNMTFSYTGTDANIGVKKYSVKLDNGGWVDNSTLTSYEFLELPTGLHTLHVRATDSADNNTDANVGVIVEGGALCGNGACDATETTATCPEDCPTICGDGACTGVENPENCPEDCLSACGDGLCDSSAGETCDTCSSDCGTCAGPEPPPVVPSEEVIAEQTQAAQPDALDIEAVLTESGFTINKIADAKDAAGMLNVVRNIKVVKKTEAETGAVSYDSRITISLTNTTDSVLKNIRIVEKVPKAVASTSKEIKSNKPFAVLKDDPILQFTISELAAGKTGSVSYSVAKQLTSDAIGAYIVAPIPSYAVTAEDAVCELIDCDDSNPCTTDLCFSGECAYVLVNDRTSCGFGKECMAGVCTAVAPVGPVAGTAEVGIVALAAAIIIVLIVVALFKLHGPKKK